MPTDEDERIARTESLFRRVNERIAETARRFGAEDASFVCQCADAECTKRVRATLAEYETARAEGARFLLAPGHERGDVERVEQEGARFTLVEKVRPRVRLVAEQLDPRAQEA